MQNVEALRHVHWNFVDGIKTLGYVVVLGAAFKYLLNRFHVPGLTELFNYVI